MTALQNNGTPQHKFCLELRHEPIYKVFGEQKLPPSIMHLWPAHFPAMPNLEAACRLILGHVPNCGRKEALTTRSLLTPRSAFRTVAARGLELSRPGPGTLQKGSPRQAHRRPETNPEGRPRQYVTCCCCFDCGADLSDVQS